MAELKKRQFRGVVCVSAEYGSPDKERLVAEDLRLVKSLFV
jgi:hypothetical protein